MLDFWETDLTNTETDEILDKIAGEVQKRRLEVPVVMALEMHKPLARVAGNAGVVFAPFLVPFLGFKNVNDYSRLFNNPENVERLIQRLESGSTKTDNQDTKTVMAQGTSCNS
jgi:hypothetical protein